MPLSLIGIESANKLLSQSLCFSNWTSH